MNLIVNKDSLEIAYNVNGYKLETKLHNYLNIFGIRGYYSSGKNDDEAKFNDNELNIYNDTLGVLFKDDYDNSNLIMWRATTDPGRYYLEDPLNVKGTAQLIPDQYVDAYEIDYHRSKYLALCQKLAPVKVRRFKTLDDYNKGIYIEDEGIFAINIHKSLDEVPEVNKASAGCQVFFDVQDFNILMALAKKHREKFGNKFTYTLFNREDFLES